MFIINEYKIKQKKENIIEVSQNFKTILEERINHILLDEKSILNSDDIKIYEYDELILNTNVSKDFTLRYYVELNNEKLLKPSEIAKKNKNNIPDYYIKLEQLKKDILNDAITFFDENFLIYENELSIGITYNHLIDDDRLEVYQFEIIPCFTYINTNNERGVIYYSNNFANVNIDYPLLAITNFNKKNLQTNNSFNNIIVIFKNIYLKSQKTIPFEFLEILLYNIPEQLYSVNLHQCSIRIINYLKNKSLSECKTIDEQDYAFTSKNKTLSYLFAKSIINNISKFLNNNL